MVCRDVTRGEEARQEIITQTGNQVSVCHYSQHAGLTRNRLIFSGITSKVKKIYINM